MSRAKQADTELMTDDGGTVTDRNGQIQRQMMEK